MSDPKNYLNTFQRAADLLDEKLLKEKQIEVIVAEGLGCFFLKLYKRSWASPNEDPVSAKSRIFFSVWANDANIAEQKMFYNIHAFKLRQLHGYSIESKKFADAFRISFSRFEHQWPNVSLKFGPLTLMEGWIKIDPENFHFEIWQLANDFLAIEHLIDDTLAKFRRQ